MWIAQNAHNFFLCKADPNSNSFLLRLLPNNYQPPNGLSQFTPSRFPYLSNPFIQFFSHRQGNNLRSYLKYRRLQMLALKSQQVSSRLHGCKWLGADGSGRGRRRTQTHATGLVMWLSRPLVPSLGHLWNSKNSNNVLNIKANRIRCLSSKTGANGQSWENFTFHDLRVFFSLHSLLSFGGKELQVCS